MTQDFRPRHQRVEHLAHEDAAAPDRLPNERLAALRLNRGWTQHDLAAAVAQVLGDRNIHSGIDADYISRLERGLISWPTTATRQALEMLLGVSAAEMGFINRRLGGPRRRHGLGDAGHSPAVPPTASTDERGNLPTCLHRGSRSTERRHPRTDAEQTSESQRRYDQPEQR